MTKRQKDVLDFLRAYRRREGVSPTIQEIADKLGVSKAAILQLVTALEEQGLVVRGEGRERNLLPAHEELVAKSDVLAIIDRTTPQRAGFVYGKLRVAMEKVRRGVESLAAKG